MSLSGLARAAYRRRRIACRYPILFSLLPIVPLSSYTKRGRASRGDPRFPMNFKSRESKRSQGERTKRTTSRLSPQRR